LLFKAAKLSGQTEIGSRILLTDNERCAVALGKLMADAVTIVKPDTMLK
jgi:hypothetical protein